MSDIHREQREKRSWILEISDKAIYHFFKGRDGKLICGVELKKVENIFKRALMRCGKFY